ncbi:XkdX family protein [Enterococcus faecalis]|uniref:XkdX family protein n=1 Tax=Enterococcus faecalis TaxID=1351 RepID=UPI00032F17C9|nr:XkdX family protein [Enterococcus faecalis]EOL50846.1 hypothetical protein UCE_03175 [Enterococcus faecalis EnGen0239]OXM11471.1 XkdX family protein [Enterococcus faecalis]HAP2961210.1 XkdX family protein [Enterococcus faecalis]
MRGYPEFEDIKYFYDEGYYTDDDIAHYVEIGYLTSEEYKKITGQPLREGE